MHDLRLEIRAAFQAGGCAGHPPFLRRSQGEDSLLCTDAPRRLPHPEAVLKLLLGKGLILAEENGLWFLDVPLRHYEVLSRELPVTPPPMPEDQALMDIWALCGLLLAHPCPVSSQPLEPVRLTLKAIEAGSGQAEALARDLPPRLAVMLRQKSPLPALAGSLLAEWLLQKEMLSC